MNFPNLVVTANGMVMDGHPLAPPFFSLWTKYPQLRGRSLVIGLIGPRGSGKSTGAARILVLDYLLKGKTIWSNMPVGVDLCLNGTCCPLRSIDIASGLDISQCSNGVVFLDEVNQGYADSWRSMSRESLDFAYETQQLRKSKLDLIWTTQSETFTNPRLRFQTDIIIKCADLSLTKKKVGIGEYSRWEIWDYSGIVTGQLSTTKLPDAPVMFTKPWWRVFDTTKKQGQAEQAEAAAGVTDDPKLVEIANSMAREVENANGKMGQRVLWDHYKVYEVKERAAIVKLLSLQFGITRDAQNRYFLIDRDLVGV